MEDENEMWKDIYDAHKSSIWVVSMSVSFRGNIKTSKATGFSLDNAGLIMTCAHAFATETGKRHPIYVHKIDQNKSFNVRAELVFSSPNWDISILKIKSQDLNYVKFANDGSLTVGQTICHIGNNLCGSFYIGRVAFPCTDIVFPNQANYKFSLEAQPPRYITAGNLYTSISGEENEKYLKQLESSLPLIHGNNFGIMEGCSGGPLFNSDGKVVGMTIMGRTNEMFAVHVSALKHARDVYLASIESAKMTQGNTSKKPRRF